jgi:hypothetical protein
MGLERFSGKRGCTAAWAAQGRIGDAKRGVGRYSRLKDEKPSRRFSVQGSKVQRVGALRQDIRDVVDFVIKLAFAEVHELEKK